MKNAKRLLAVLLSLIMLLSLTALAETGQTIEEIMSENYVLEKNVTMPDEIREQAAAVAALFWNFDITADTLFASCTPVEGETGNSSWSNIPNEGDPSLIFTFDETGLLKRVELYNIQDDTPTDPDTVPESMARFEDEETIRKVCNNVQYYTAAVLMNTKTERWEWALIIVAGSGDALLDNCVTELRFNGSGTWITKATFTYLD